MVKESSFEKSNLPSYEFLRVGERVEVLSDKPEQPDALRSLINPFRAILPWVGRRYSGIRFRFVDVICLIYMALIGALLPFVHKAVPFWQLDFLIHLLFVICGLEIIRLGERNSGKKLFVILRSFYPIAFYAYGWNELGHMVRMFFGSYWMIDFLVTADYELFGVHPTVWVQRLYTPWLDELFNFCYSGYYFFPLITIYLFYRRKHKELSAVLSIVAFTYFTTFILFYIFPALGPCMIPWLKEMRYTDFTGYIAGPFTKFVQANGAIPAGAFPSSHVSGAVAWALAIWRYHRKMGYLYVPMALGVAIATVYLGYHHAVDPIAGLILGFLCYGIALKFLKIRKEDPEEVCL